MKKHSLIKQLIALVLCLSMLPLSALAMATPVAAASDGESRYYYSQLATANSRSIYASLQQMLEDGSLAKGDALVKLNVADEGYDEAVKADFISAKDAFMFDYSDIFYVDFDKMSISKTEEGYFIGIGREETYLRDGFNGQNAEDVTAAIEAYAAKVNAIATAAQEKSSLKESVQAAFEGVMAAISYALEADAQPENMLFVRTPYGGLVKDEAVCEGYARALKSVLDQLGVENVLVQGVYDDGTYSGPHMWNYVRMDDNRWYFLDATMEDGLKESTGSTTAQYFLCTGEDELLQNYLPDGVISLSSDSFEFAYPDLSPVNYTPMGDYFTIVTKGSAYYLDMVGYKGMGLAAAAAQETPEYIVGSHNGTDWFYVDRAILVGLYGMGYGDITELDLLAAGYDTADSFMNFIGAAYLAVTKQAPTAEFDANDPNAYYRYTASLDTLYNQSQVGQITEYKKAPPFVSYKEPGNTTLQENKTYSMKVVYSESLKMANSQQPVELQWVREIPGAVVSDFQWDGDRTITFTLTTATTYYRIANYYFQLENLIGVSSGQKPNPVCYSVIKSPKFACPKIPGDISEIYANTPALISDSDVSASDFVGADGQPLSSTLPNRLALVASTPTAQETADMLATLPDNILSAKTYDISLSLCSNQVSYITGKKVKVYVPFPDGYNAESNVTFKVYHFDKNGNPEEVECITTEYGIILLCDAFSPYAVVAAPKEEVTTKNLMLHTQGQGSITVSAGLDTSSGLVKLQASGSSNLTITPDSGYMIDTITLNGQSIAVTNTGSMTLELTFEQLQDSNVLEVSFVVDRTPVEDTQRNGIYEEDGTLWLYKDGNRHYGGLFAGDGVYGEIGYYYYAKTSGEIVNDCRYWISKTNGLLPEYSYTFDANGRIVDAPVPPVTDPDSPVKNGMVEENGKLYYYVDGKLTYAGLILIDGDYYYVNTKCEVICGRSYWISKTNGLLPEKSYTFDETGKMLNAPVTDPDAPVKNGIVEENGKLYYYVDSQLTYAGVICIDGDYYYVNSNYEVISGKTYWITKTNGLLAEKAYTFDAKGKILDPVVPPVSDPDAPVKNGIVEENGKLYYYVDGKLTYAGVICIDGDYYYVNSKCEVVCGQIYWISMTNGLLPEMAYTFDETGKMI